MKNLITEQFLTVQGEGRSVGKLAYFIRFAGCNLWCGWCDSMHSVDPALFRGKTLEIDYADVPDHCNLIVLTGGEPTLFDLGLVRSTLAQGHPSRVFEVESNATSFPEKIVDDFVWNLSPKLKSSQQKTPAMDEKRLKQIRRWGEYSRGRDNVTFKFVVSGEEDLVEIQELIAQHQIEPHLVYLMAEGQSQESQALERVEWLIEHCKRTGFNFSPRLHVLYWGDRRGV